MFQVGEKIIYGNTGVCEVGDITHLKMDGIDESKLYYLLIPLNEKKSKIYTPTDNDKVKMRRVLTKQEAEELVNEIESVDEMGIMPNDKAREEKYKQALKTCDCREWIRMIKTLYMKKQNLIASGKKFPNTDEKYLRQAESNLYEELSVALDIDKNGMEQYIIDRVNSGK